MERRQAGDELQILGDEEEVADGHEDGQEVDDECGAELGLPEREVDHRVRQPPLTPDPEGPHEQAPTTAAIATGPMPSWAICFSPKITASTAATAIAALGRSSRPASGSRDSAEILGPRTRSATITGIARRKTEPHQKNSRAIPPRTEPIALPAENAPIHTPIATVRSVGSWNMKKISANVDGARVAPEMPSAARLTMSISGVVENAANTDVIAKAAAPSSRSRRRRCDRRGCPS